MSEKEITAMLQKDRYASVFARLRGYLSQRIDCYPSG